MKTTQNLTETENKRNKYLEVNNGVRDFFIVFRGSNRKFIFNTASGLLELLKNFDKYGIEQIKEFDTVKLKFKRVSIKTVVLSLNHNTELNLDYFKKSSFFN